MMKSNKWGNVGLFLFQCLVIAWSIRPLHDIKLVAAAALVLVIGSAIDGAFCRDDSKRKMVVLSMMTLLAIIMIIIPIHQRIVEKEDFNYNNVHDGALQTEYAVKLLSEGRNLYSEDTPEGWFGIHHSRISFRGGNNERYFAQNPALFHYIYPPLFTIQSYIVSQCVALAHIDFDQRYVLILYVALLVWVLTRLPISQRMLQVGIFGLILSPYSLEFLLQGRNDIVVFTWLLAMLVALHKKKSHWAIFSLALACSFKQSAWPMVPFVYLYLYYHWQSESAFGYCRRAMRESVWPLVVALLAMVPFAIWDFHGMWNDMILYPSGKLPTSYPVNGFSLVAILMKLGIYVKDPAAYYPVWVVQLPVYMATLIWTARLFRRDCRVSMLVRQLTIGMGFFWFFSRFFHDNYINFTIMMVIVMMIFRSIEKCRQTSSAN